MLVTMKAGFRMTSVQRQSEHRQTSQGMTDRAEIARNRGIIAESDVPEVFYESVNQVASRLVDVPRRAERTGKAMAGVARSASEGI